jgi:hypothetical protein
MIPTRGAEYKPQHGESDPPGPTAITIGDEGAIALAALTALVHLNVRRQRIGDVGASALSALNSLCHLSASGQDVGDAAV